MSQRRLEANRRNAQKSTGPRTPAGKATVARNALQHGLLARAALARGESEAELVEFAKRMRRQLAPAGELELLLADRVISCAWRLRRVMTVEAAVIDQDVKNKEAWLSYVDGTMTNLSRYEAALERGLYKALHELRQLQAEHDARPARVLDASEIDAAASDEPA